MENCKNKFLKDAYLKKMADFYNRTSCLSQTDYTAVINQYKEKSGLKESAFFYDSLIDNNSVIAQDDRTKPLVGYFCNLVPQEIILACGCLPVRLCSEDISYSQDSEDIVSGDICPVIKSVCGSLRGSKLKDIDLLIVPAACDAKLKLAEIISPFKDIYFLDLQRDSNYLKNAASWEEEYYRLFTFLKNKYNRKVSRSDLLTASEVLNKRTAVFRKIYNFRAENPGIISSFDYFMLAENTFFSSPEAWIEHAQKMYAEACGINSRQPAAFKGRRLLLSGAPLIFPNFKLLDILAEINCDVSSDLLCSAFGALYNPVEIDEETEEGIIRALGLKYIAATLCPCFLGVDKLIDAIIDTVQRYNLDGVIYHNLRLCQIYEMQIVLLRQILKEKGIPFLSIKTDLGKEDTAQIKTRLEAYLEMLKT